MPSDKDSAGQGTSPPATSPGQEPQAELLEATQEPDCATCHGSENEPCRRSCTHCFCLPCIEGWSRSRSVCYSCWQPLHHPFPPLGDHSRGVQGRTQHSDRGRTRRRRRRRRRSSGRWRRSNSVRDRGSGHPGAPRGRQSRSLRWCDDEHRQDQHPWSYGSSRSGRQQWRRAWDTARDEDISASSRRSQRRGQARWDSSRRRQRTRSRSRHRSRSNRDRAWWEHSRGQRSRRRWQSRDREHSQAQGGQRSRSPWQDREIHTGTYISSVRWRQRRSRDDDEGRAPRPEEDIPTSGRSRSRRRSHRSRGRVRREGPGQRGWGERGAPSPDWEVSAYSRRRKNHCQGQRRVARSRSQRRSRSRARSRAW